MSKPPPPGLGARDYEIIHAAMTAKVGAFIIELEGWLEGKAPDRTAGTIAMMTVAMNRYLKDYGEAEALEMLQRAYRDAVTHGKSGLQ